jgi:UDP:flavonoid glycosyltransferase YjiC (YdhE family)
MPMSLRSPSIRHVPLIGLGHFPLGILSKDTAPMGMGLPSQGIEKNRLLNQDAIAMFASVAACERRLLEPYHCTKALPSPYHFDNWVLLCDVYFQLSVPALELPRSDLPANVRFCGALEGHNAAAGTGTNMTTTTALLPPWFNDFVRPSSPTDSRPLILVTSGTLPGQSAHDLILPTISACATLPVRLVVCAVHVPFDPDYALPPNVRWAQWIPFEAILPYTALVVSSGGYGSITQAFAHGVPIVCAGVTEEKMHTGMLAEASGAGINLKTQTPDVEQVRAAVLEMLRNPRFSKKAEELGEAYREADPVGRLVEAIEEILDRLFSNSNS